MRITDNGKPPNRSLFSLSPPFTIAGRGREPDKTVVRPVAVPLAGNGGLAEATQCPGQHYDQRNDDALLKWALSGAVQVLCRITPTIIYFPNMYLSGTWVRDSNSVGI